MPSKQFAVEKSGPKRLGISYKGFYKNFVITFDGKTIGTINDDKKLEKGMTFTLPDNSVLSVRLIKEDKYMLEILRNEVPIPGSATHPVVLMKVALMFSLPCGLFSLIFGIGGTVFGIRLFSELSFGWASVIGGVLTLLFSISLIHKIRVSCG